MFFVTVLTLSSLEMFKFLPQLNYITGEKRHVSKYCIQSLNITQSKKYDINRNDSESFPFTHLQLEI